MLYGSRDIGDRWAIYAPGNNLPLAYVPREGNERGAGTVRKIANALHCHEPLVETMRGLISAASAQPPDAEALTAAIAKAQEVLEAERSGREAR